MATLFARLIERVRLEANADGRIVACFDGHSLALGQLSARSVQRAQELRRGVALRSLQSDHSRAGKEIDRLVRQLARSGLIEFHLCKSGRDSAQAIIQPQMPDYWPRTPPLRNADVLVLSRFAYMRRRAHELVLESPRAGALFKIGDAAFAGLLAALSQPHAIQRLRQNAGFPGIELLSLLLDSNILIKIDERSGSSLRRQEGDSALALWDFHDLLFHARSTEGRHANPLGGTYPHAGDIAPLPAVRPSWPGKKVRLRNLRAASTATLSPLRHLLQQRHSTRVFDERRSITLAELARFLVDTARVQSTASIPSEPEAADDNDYAPRPYPSAGASYELELYLAVHACEGLDRGFYHYDAGAHALVPIAVGAEELEATLRAAAYAMGVAAPPHILITIAARFGRVAWKYSALAYALVLKDAGVLMQTFYLRATDMGLGGCAIGIANIDLFAKMTGIKFHVEGPVGQFALGRAEAGG